MEHYKHEDITRRIIGCAMRVHGELGNGFQEVIYQRCLAIEFKDEELEFLREQGMRLFYKEHEVGARRADFIVERKVLVELKAVSELNDIHMAQTLNYLKAYKYEVALLINFGRPSLQFKRLVRTLG